MTAEDPHPGQLDAELRAQNAERGRLKETKERRWREAGAAMLEVLGPPQWRQADLPRRMVLLSEVHERLRPSFDLQRSTRLVFAIAIQGGGAMGCDEETGEYIVVALGELEREDPGPLIAGLAHELRHAFQHEARDGLVDDPRAEEWRDSYEVYEPDGPAYDNNALEIDASDAQADVLAGYEGQAD